MARCVIHIGMHKTGSTSIQRSLHRFSSEHFTYADLDGNPNHIWALSALFAGQGRRTLLRRRGGKLSPSEYEQKVRANLQRSIDSLQGRTLIISAEGLSTQFGKADLAAMHEYLQAYFDEISIVGYVRPPAALMASGFQARLKGRLVARFRIEKLYPHYQAVLGKFDEIFGREHVHLWKFNPESFIDGCAVRDFCSRLDIDLPADRITRHNEAIPRQAVCLLYTYRKLGKRYGSDSIVSRERSRLVDLLRQVGKDKFRFSPDIIRPVLQKNGADIEWMEARLGQSLLHDLGEYQPGDVRDEADLLTPDREGVANLRALLGDQLPAGITGETVEDVVRLVDCLRRARASAAGAVPRPRRKRSADSGRTHLDVAELVGEIQKMNSQLLEGVGPSKAEALVRGVFQHIKTTLAGTSHGVVDYAGLGRFRMRSQGEARGRMGRAAIRFHRAKQGRRSQSRGTASTA